MNAPPILYVHRQIEAVEAVASCSATREKDVLLVDEKAEKVSKDWKEQFVSKVLACLPKVESINKTVKQPYSPSRPLCVGYFNC